MRSYPEVVSSREAPAKAARAQVASVQADLAAMLGDDHAVYLRLGPEGAVMSVKGRGTFAFGESFSRRWHEMTPQERAKAVLKWIQKAAKYCRNPRMRWLPA